MRIEYQNVDIAQEEHVILKGVNFQAEAGEFVYLIGKVGTGKSSLLKTFYGELDVHTGSARVLDREMTKIKSRTALEPDTCAVNGLKRIIMSKDLRKLTFSMIEDNYRWMR